MSKKSLSRGGKGGLGASATVALMMLATVVAKGLGLFRQVLMASTYGTSSDANVFSVASQIPLQFFDLLFATAISGCFIPAYNSFKRGKNGEISPEADDFSCSFFNFILISTGVLALLGIALASPIASLLGFESTSDKQLAAELMRIMFPMIIFTGTAYTLTGVMQSKGRYLIPAMISALSNLTVIIYFMFFNDSFGVQGLAVAYVLGWVFQFLTLAVPLRTGGYRFRPVLHMRTQQMKRTLRQVPAIMMGSWLLPATTIVTTYFTSFIGTNGSVLFNYADNAFIMISGILTYSICNYALPKLSALAADESEQGERDFVFCVRSGLVSVMALILPFMAVIMLLSPEIVAALYMRGGFTAEDTSMVSTVMTLLLAAMPAFAIIEFGSRVFYAKKLGRVPMTAALCGVGVDAVLAALSVFAFKAEGLGGVCLVVGSTVIGFYVAAAVMICGAVKYVRALFDRELLSNLLRIVLASAVSAAVCLGVLRLISAFRGGIDVSGGTVYNIIICAVAFVPAALVYLLLLKLLHISFGSLGSRQTSAAGDSDAAVSPDGETAPDTSVCKLNIASDTDTEHATAPDTENLRKDGDDSIEK